MTTLIRKFYKIFFVEVVIKKNSCVRFDTFSKPNGPFIFHTKESAQ